MFWEKIDAFKYSFFDPIANRGYLFTSPNESVAVLASNVVSKDYNFSVTSGYVSSWMTTNKTYDEVRKQLKLGGAFKFLLN